MARVAAFHGAAKQALEDIADASASEGDQLSLSKLLERLVPALTAHVHCDMATCFLHDQGTAQLITRWATSLPSDFASSAKSYIRIPQHTGLAGAAFSGGGAAVCIPNAYADPAFNRQIDKASGYRTKVLLQ